MEKELAPPMGTRSTSSMEEFQGGSESSGFPREGPVTPEDRAPRRKPINPTPGGGIGSGAKVDYKEKSFEVGDTGAGTGMGGFESGTVTPEGTGGSEDTRGIKSFQCPICGDDVEGESEEELSSSFGNHLIGNHRDEPFINRLMTKIGSR